MLADGKFPHVQVGKNPCKDWQRLPGTKVALLAAPDHLHIWGISPHLCSVSSPASSPSLPGVAWVLYGWLIKTSPSSSR